MPPHQQQCTWMKSNTENEEGKKEKLNCVKNRMWYSLVKSKNICKRKRANKNHTAMRAKEGKRERERMPRDRLNLAGSSFISVRCVMRAHSHSCSLRSYKSSTFLYFYSIHCCRCCCYIFFLVSSFHGLNWCQHLSAKQRSVSLTRSLQASALSLVLPFWCHIRLNDASMYTSNRQTGSASIEQRQSHWIGTAA